MIEKVGVVDGVKELVIVAVTCGDFDGVTEINGVLLDGVTEGKIKLLVGVGEGFGILLTCLTIAPALWV